MGKSEILEADFAQHELRVIVVHNTILANQLEDLGRLRQIQGANAFRSGAYFTAAEAVKALSEPVTDASQLKVVKGVGKKLLLVIEVLLTHGTHCELEENKDLLASVRELIKVPGIGSKTAMNYVARGIVSLDDLRHAIDVGEIRREGLLDAIDFAEMNDGGRIPTRFVLPAANAIVLKLAALGESVVERSTLTGSVRRRKETVKDVDILIASSHSQAVVETFLSCGTEIESGYHNASIFVWFDAGFGPKQFRVDLMIVPRKCWGAALCHFTGSKAHNIELRTLAKARGINVSQNGIIGPDGEWLGGEEEKDLYEILGLSYIQPEDRE